MSMIDDNATDDNLAEAMRAAEAVGDWKLADALFNVLAERQWQPPAKSGG